MNTGSFLGIVPQKKPHKTHCTCVSRVMLPCFYYQFPVLLSVVSDSLCHAHMVTQQNYDFIRHIMLTQLSSYKFLLNSEICM